MNEEEHNINYNTIYHLIIFAFPINKTIIFIIKDELFPSRVNRWLTKRELFVENEVQGCRRNIPEILLQKVQDKSRLQYCTIKKM